MIYGLDFNTYELLRIGSDGSLVSLGVLDALDQQFEFYSGGMTPDGRRLMLIARSKETGLDERVYSVRVNDPNFPTGFFALVADGPTAMTDVSVDPIVGTNYSFDEHTRQIILTNPTGETFTNLGFKKVNQIFGALFSDQNGQLYGLGNAGGSGAEQSIIYAIKKETGETQRVTQVVGGRDTDACACPFTFQFDKTIKPRVTDGCSEVLIEYNMINRGGIGQIGINMQDLLPPEFTILDVETNREDVFVRVLSGLGANYLEIDNWNLLIGDNFIRVKAQVQTNIPGLLASQAKIDNMFPAYGGQFYSNDPFTLEVDDPTGLKILDPQAFELEESLQFSCDLDTAFLSLPIEGEYRWSTGSTDPVLAVTEFGSYQVTVTTDCYEVNEDIMVLPPNESLFVELGETRKVNLGERVQLSYQTNLTSENVILWEVDSSLVNLDCIDCPRPSFEAIRDSEVRLIVKDERGCLFEDVLRIEVNETKNIYLPNAFSPNNDGINDAFKVMGDNGTLLSFQVFDRWGNLIFQEDGASVNASLGWDGKIKGENAPRGVYLYAIQIQFPDQEIKSYQGEVLLVSR